jgi:hypothetical protein
LAGWQAVAVESWQYQDGGGEDKHLGVHGKEQEERRIERGLEKGRASCW